MTATVSIRDGQLVVERDGVTKLDTALGLFHAVRRIPAGERTFPAIAATASFQRITNTYDIGTCPEGCTHVIGAVKMTLNGATTPSGLAFNRWTTYLGGTIVWVMSGDGLTSAAAGDQAAFPHTYCGYSFNILGTTVRLRQEVILPGSKVTYGIRSHDIAWKLKVGRFN